MCGICGFIGAGSMDDLSRMSMLLQHRGPDDFGTWSSATSPIQLASRRLSVVDLPGGHQPMLTADGQLVIVFNGEIYNHRELRDELEKLGHKFQTDHSDTEVLLLGYREWGVELPGHLNGMWAFALYDVSRGTLFCSRDRFGEKPFCYAQTKDAFVFASELTSLVRHPSVSRTVSGRALQKYFAYGYVPSPLSIYEGAVKLPAGCSLSVDVRSFECRIEKYWDLLLEPFATIPRNPEEEWGQRIRELLDRAIQRRLIADVPVGVFLSGGIDSSAVTALASRHISNGKLKTFSVGFHEKTFYETRFALRRAELYRRIFPRPLHAAIKALFDRLPVSHANMALDFKIKRTLRGLDYDPRLWLPMWMAPIDIPSLEELFSKPIDIEDLYSEAIEQWKACPQTDLADKTLQFYTKLYLQDEVLVKVERESMI